ncbi:MAG: hypothetical protein QXS42_02185 [Zestosphaera sp.]
MRLCKFLLDTSTLLLVSEGVDLSTKLQEDLDCDRVELYTLDAVVRELESLASSRSVRKAPPARHALNYVRERVAVLKAGEGEASGDNSILKYAASNPEYIIVTLDERLRKLLKVAGVRVATWWFSKRRFTTA